MLPAYIRIHDKIKANVDDGTWKIGQRLPSERDLCDTFDVSRMTVRQAITLLVDEGILERKPGSGTFVASSRVKEKMRGTTSFTEIVKSQGKKPSSELISYKRVHPNEFEIKNLGVLPQSYVIRMERVRFADDLPVAYEIASIPEKIIRGFKESEITEHFFKTLTDNGYEIGKSQQTISASLANSSLAKHLKVKTGDALLSLTQISFLQDGQAFEYVRSYYVGDRFEFYLENN